MNIFVIMPFKDAYDPLYREIIQKACTDRRLPVTRGDQILKHGNIPHQILKMIQEAFFIIAEISEDNPNVFYEVGYGHALNKPIIAIADRKRVLPFDVSGERTIFYDTSKAGWENRLRSDLGDMIDQLFDLGTRFRVDSFTPGDELFGDYHRISGRIINLEGGKHLWLFVKREDLDLWSAQNDGEIEVGPDGIWKANMYLGWANEREAQNKRYDVIFGTLGPTDNRELTEMCIWNRIRSDFPPRQLPHLLTEVYRARVKRVE